MVDQDLAEHILAERVRSALAALLPVGRRVT
jgi:hypothetical protein